MSDTGLYDDSVRFFHTSVDGTFIQREGQAKLLRIVANGSSTAAGTLTIYNSSVGSGPVVSVINANGLTKTATLEYGIVLTSGLTAVADSLANGADFTIVYQ